MIAVASSRPWHESAFDEIEARLAMPVARIRTSEELAPRALEERDVRRIFFLHWSRIIPPEVHTAFECIVFHMTDLPFGRGGSPLQNLIVRGYQDTVLTAFRCEAGIDSGPVYLKRPLSLEGSASEIFERATGVMLDMIQEIVATNPAPRPQEGSPVYFSRRKPEQSDLSACTTPDQAYDMIRMLDAEGYPRAFMDSAGLRFEFSGVEREGDQLKATVTISRK